MSAKNDLALAYHMGYDDALAKRKPDASKTQILASDDLAAENAKMRELLGDALKTLFHKRLDGSVGCTENCPRWQFGKDCQLVDGCWLEIEAARLGVEVPYGS